MTYRLVADPKVVRPSFPPQWQVDWLFDGDRFALDAAIYDWGITPRHYFLIEQIDEEPGMPRRVRRP